MRYLVLTTIVVTLTGCAAQPPTPEAAMIRHAANISAAEDAGYSVINSDKGQTLFCATRAPTGSHLVRPCLTETQWEQQQIWVWHGANSSAQAESGRSPLSGAASYGL